METVGIVALGQSQSGAFVFLPHTKMEAHRSVVVVVVVFFLFFILEKRVGPLSCVLWPAASRRGSAKTITRVSTAEWGALSTNFDRDATRGRLGLFGVRVLIHRAALCALRVGPFRVFFFFLGPRVSNPVLKIERNPNGFNFADTWCRSWRTSRRRRKSLDRRTWIEDSERVFRARLLERGRRRPVLCTLCERSIVFETDWKRPFETTL